LGSAPGEFGVLLKNEEHFGAILGRFRIPGAQFGAFWGNSGGIEGVWDAFGGQFQENLGSPGQIRGILGQFGVDLGSPGGILG